LIRRYGSPLAYFLLWAPYIAVYQVTNRWPVREPTTLPLTSLDQAIPFAPSLLPVYVAYLALFFWTVARSKSDAEVRRAFYGTHLQLLLSLPFFILAPVRMPREVWYGSELFGWADAFWRWFDAPNNCFPSLHVSNSLLFLQLNWQRSNPLAHSLVALAVIASTVLVKQHYIVDVLGGVAVYLVSRALMARLGWGNVASAAPR
jgi:membrane-associated phospholipid phosphatase